MGSLGLDSSLPGRNLLLVNSLLPQGSFLGLLLFNGRFFVRVLLDADTIKGACTQGNLAHNVWHVGVACKDSLDRVAVAIPRPVEKVVVPLTTR